MSSERSSWAVQGESIHDELIQLMGLTPAETAALGALASEAAAAAGAMTADFYGRLLAHANTREFLDGIDMAVMHAGTGQWFTELFSGRYDSAYVQRRLHIGLTHARIGLPVRYPLAMIDVVLEHGLRLAGRAPQPELAQTAFRKVMALDVAIFNQAYEDNQLHHLAELVGGERLARRVLSGLA
jgi:hypothetical protein